MKEARCAKLVFLVIINGGHSGTCNIYSQIKIACSTSGLPTSLHSIVEALLKPVGKAAGFISTSGSQKDLRRRCSRPREQQRNIWHWCSSWHHPGDVLFSLRMGPVIFQSLSLNYFNHNPKSMWQWSSSLPLHFLTIPSFFQLYIHLPTYSRPDERESWCQFCGTFCGTRSL